MNHLKNVENICYQAMSEEELKEEILAIWEDVFGYDYISALDTFYELGGDSIKEIQIVSQLRNMGAPISRLDWFATINQLAKEMSIETKKETVDKSKNLDATDLTEFEKHCQDCLFDEKIEEAA